MSETFLYLSYSSPCGNCTQCLQVVTLIKYIATWGVEEGKGRTSLWHTAILEHSILTYRTIHKDVDTSINTQDYDNTAKHKLAVT